MRLLIVGMVNSIHIARWINQFSGLDWDIHLFPSTGVQDPRPELTGVTLHHPLHHLPVKSASGVTHHFLRRRLPLPRSLARHANYVMNAFLIRGDSAYNARALAKLIAELKPDIVHSIEFQHAGYTTLEARHLLSTPFPKWIITNWGNDTYFFGRLDAHIPRIKQLLEECDYYDCECERDLQFARHMGLKGQAWPVFPNTSGFDLENTRQLIDNQHASSRRTILLKGYQGLFGRALFGLRAIALCADILQDYEIVLYSTTPEVDAAAELIAKETGLTIRIQGKGSHEDMLRLHGQARISMGVNISDGIATSMLEAIVMGSFPIQSSTACADEWIDDGVNGFIVPPEDPHAIALALRRALTDDKLVDAAAEENARIARDRLDADKLRALAVDLYQSVLNKS